MLDLVKWSNFGQDCTVGDGELCMAGCLQTPTSLTYNHLWPSHLQLDAGSAKIDCLISLTQMGPDANFH